MRLQALLALILLAMGATTVSAATFYVSPSGNDSANGQSEATAWKTIAKVNGTTFAPGDIIRFQRGGEWREALSASSSGAVGNPITYDAYGNGAKPKFWGSEVLVAVNWVFEGGTVYRYDINQSVTSVLANHGLGAGGQWFNNQTGNPVQNFPGAYTWSGNQLRINSASDPRSDGRVYTAVVRDDLVNSNGKNNLVFRNLQADESADPADGYCFRVMGSANVLIEDCDAFRAARHHFGTINSTGFVGRRLYSAYAMPSNDRATFYVSFSDAQRSGDSSEWIDCTGEHFENGGNRNHQVMYNHGEGLGTLLIQNMISRGGDMGVGQDRPTNVITIKGGLLENAGMEIFASNTVVDGLTITGEKGVIDCYGSSNTFQNCKLVNIKPIGGGPTGYKSAIVFRNNARTNVVRFNTVVMDPTAEDWGTCITFVANGLQTKWYGNILHSNKRVASRWGGGNMDASDAVQTNYNLFNANATFNDNNYTFALWQAQGIDANSLAADPLFVNSAGADFSLQSNSPAVNAAPVGAGNFPATDFTGAGRPSGIAPDIGAYERSVAGPQGPAINQQPLAQSVQVGQTATFTITASGTAPLSYQWQKNNTDIPNATSASYTTPATVIGDNGATFRCVVTNSVSSATSNSASLTVTAAPTGPSIAQHPTNQSVQVGQTATLTITANGSAPLSYQWQKNNTDIPNATSASYTTPATVIGDNGATFRCIVTNSVSSATSNSASLTVTQPNGQVAYGGTPWPVPGKIEAEDFDVGGAGVAYNDSSAGSANVYRVSDVDIEATPVAGGNYNIGVIAAGEWLEYTINVESTGAYSLEAYLGWPGTGGGVFHYELDGVDISGPITIPQSNGFWWDWRSVAKNGVTLPQGVHVLRISFDTANGNGHICNFDALRISRDGRTASGSVLYEYWLGIPGSLVSELTSSPKYAAPADGALFLSTFEAPITWNNSFGARMSGLVTAPQTGAYTFRISGDDNCELWLSNDMSPANAQRIARVPGATRPREWNKYPEQQSISIVLEQGKTYYVFALQKEGGNDDNMAVGWTLPDGSDEYPMSGEHLAAATRKPYITSGPVATPNPAQIAEAVAMAVAALDPDGDLLSYEWTFGDGVNGSGSDVQHPYVSAGVYDVAVTISDGNGGTTKGNVIVMVQVGSNPGGGNGNGGDDGNGNGGGGGGANPDPNILPLQILKMSGAVKFTLAGKDTCGISGVILGLPIGFDPTGVPATVNVGGATAAFTLDGKGRAKTKTASLQIKLKGKRNKLTKKIDFLGGNAPFKAKISKGSWADDWADEGISPDANGKSTISMKTTLTLGTTTYGATEVAVQNSKAGKGSSFKR